MGEIIIGGDIPSPSDIQLSAALVFSEGDHFACGLVNQLLRGDLSGTDAHTFSHFYRNVYPEII